MTNKPANSESLPICPKKPVSKIAFFSHLDSDSIKAFSILAILVIGPLGAALVVDMFTGDDSPARVTHNPHEDLSPDLFLLGSEDKPHIFWFGWRPPRYWRFYHATRVSSQSDWQINECPLKFESETRFLETLGVFDSRGNIHIIGRDREELHHLILHKNGSWSGIAEIANPSLGHLAPILKLEFNSQVEGLDLFYTSFESDQLTLKKIQMNSSQCWTLKASVSLPIKHSEWDSARFIGFQCLPKNEVRIQCIITLYDNYTAEGLLCSYHTADSLKYIRNETFPFSSKTQHYSEVFFSEFQSSHIGCLESVREEVYWQYKEDGEHRIAHCSLDNLSFYVGRNPAEWKRFPLATDRFYLRYHSLDGVPCEKIGPDEYIFILPAIRVREETQGVYLIRLSTDGTALQATSQGWLTLEGKGGSNEAPLTATDSKGRIHITWSRSDGDRDTNSEIYCDYQGSGWDVIDWSLFD